MSVNVLSSRKLSAQEAADRLGVSVFTLRRMVRNGLLPAFRSAAGSSAAIRILESDLVAYVNRGRRAAA